MTISKVTKWLAALIVAGYLMTLATSHYALNTLKVGGPLYEQIVSLKDLVADILPPPEYLIESYLEATLALNAQQESATNPAARDEIEGHIKKLKALESDYQTRHSFWEGQTLEPNVKAALLKESFDPGARFWKILNDSFLPALAKSDSADAKRVYDDLSAAYKQHRVAIDHTVELANAENDRVVSEAARQETVTVTLMWAVGLVVLLMIVGGAAGVLMAILRPVNRIKGVMRELAAQNNEVEIPYTGRVDEIGEMAEAVDVFRLTMIERERLEAAAARVRELELGRQQSLDKHLEIFKDAITENIRILLNEVTQLRQASETLLDKAGEAARQASSSEQACAGAAAGSQAVAAATEQLDASVREIAQQAQNTNSIAMKATEQTQHTDGDVSSLLDGVSKIETVVTLIRQIAQHTNLLALNATIESARAGEAGRGFAVVASEVKGLSEQTAKATDEIAGQIHAVQDATDAAAASVRLIGQQISEIHHLAASVAAAVEQQQAATADIARNVNVVADGTNSAAQSARFVTEVAEHTGLEAKRVATASTQLQNVSTAVSKAVQDFIEVVTSDLRERRTASRQKVDTVLVVAASGRRHNVRTADISETGMRLEKLPGAQQNDVVEVRLGARATKAKIAWANDHGCGLQFLEPVSRQELVEAGLMPAQSRHAA